MRKHWIDYLRVIAIIAVITIHSTTPFYARFTEIRLFDWWLANLLNSASRFAIPLFVMISGSLLLRRKITIGEFYKKRAVRLLPALFVWNFFYLGLDLLYRGMNENVAASSLINKLFVNGGTAVHLWYLAMFVCLMLFAPFLNIFVKGDKPTLTDLRILLTLMFVFFLLNGISQAGSNIWDAEMEWLKTLPWYVGYFIGGYYLDRYSDHIPLKTGFLSLMIVCIVLSGTVLNYYFMTSFSALEDNLVMTNTGPLVFLITICIFLLAKRNSLKLRQNRFIAIVAEASFGMYLIHPVFLHLLEWQLPSYYANALIFIPVTICVTTFASLFSIILLRKLSFMRIIC
jgi:surface polysaccharide O-acyltransferase-like enzyme